MGWGLSLLIGSEVVLYSFIFMWQCEAVEGPHPPPSTRRVFLVIISSRCWLFGFSLKNGILYIVDYFGTFDDLYWDQ